MPAVRPGLRSVLRNARTPAAPGLVTRLSDALDALGIQRGGGADLETTSFGGAMLYAAVKRV